MSSRHGRFCSYAVAMVAVGLLFSAGSAVAQPIVTSWRTASSTQTAQVREYAGSSLVQTWPAGGLTNLGGGQATPAQPETQQIWSNGTDVFLYANDLASHVMGPWYQSGATAPYTTTNLFGRWPSSTPQQFRFTKTPAKATTTFSATGGDICLLVNGVICFNYGDSLSWRNSPSGEANPGDKIWNRLAYPVEGPTFDPAKAHQPDNGTYHYHSNPYGLRYQLGDNVSFTAGVGSATLDTYAEDLSSLHHSPILGWAYDGYPVYGPYGYSTAMDNSSGIRRMVSGFVLRNGNNGTANLTSTGRTTLGQWAADAQGRSTTLLATQYGPAVAGPNRLLGRYAEDYDHLDDVTPDVGTVWDLDRYNGRDCVTPEFPGGIYAYFVTIAADGTPAFPNIIGGQYRGVKNPGYGRSMGTPPGGTTLNFTAVKDVVQDGSASELNYTINPTRGATDQALGRFAVLPNSNGHVTHTGFTINVGTATGLSNVKLYRTNTATYTSPVQFGATGTPSGGNISFADNYTTNAATYLWLRGDVSAVAAGNLDPRLTTINVTGATPFSFGGNDALSNGLVVLPVTISRFTMD